MIDLSGPVAVVARRLLGCRLESTVGGETTELLLNEVEAYGGDEDPASHAYGGMTARNKSMFGPPGTLYVYRSYGIHWCANVVTGREGRGEAVLLRGGIPIAGREVMERRRGRRDHLTDGPGKLCEALGISGIHDGSTLLGAGPVVLRPAPEAPRLLEATPRVGISRATDRLWRFTATL